MSISHRIVNSQQTIYIFELILIYGNMIYIINPKEENVMNAIKRKLSVVLTGLLVLALVFGSIVSQPSEVQASSANKVFQGFYVSNWASGGDTKASVAKI